MRAIIACVVSLALTASSAAAQQPAAAQLSRKAPPSVLLGSKPEELLLTKITVSDLRKSYDFYTKVLGLKLASSPAFPSFAHPKLDDRDPDFVEVPLNFSGAMSEPMLLLIKQRGRAPTPEAARLTWIGFKVTNRRDIVNRATAAGHAPFRGGDSAGATFIADPDGYTVELFELPSASAQ